ncbi:MAG: glycosyltransferase family 2 protein [Planctomycetota bacterium]|jgi:glycosyltransferase involved in cell wall biosynthesis
MTDRPAVSVIVPCRNEVAFIDGCLESLLAQESPEGGFEIVVADGMSGDGTRERLAKLAARDARIRLVDNPLGITACGLNAALREARGRVIVRADAHSEYPGDYLVRCVRLLESREVSVGGGRFVNSVPDGASPVARAIGLVTANWFGVGGSPFRTRTGAGFADCVAFGAFRRAALEKVGLFDERIQRHEDSEMWHRLRSAGFGIWHDPAVCVHYYNQRTFEGFMRQALRNGFWWALTARIAPGAIRARHFAPLLFSLYVLAVPLLAAAGAVLGRPLLAAVAAAPLGLYLLLDLVASWRMSRGSERIAGGLALWPLCFLITPCYHFVYGLGWLLGGLAVVTGTWKRHLRVPPDRPLGSMGSAGAP